jgi:superfamily II DNA/RNA helicase
MKRSILNREKQFAKEVERGQKSDEIPGVNGIEGINPSALILVPTRELAIQIAREAVKLCRGLKSKSPDWCIMNLNKE